MTAIISKSMLCIFIITIVGSGLTYKILKRSYENWFQAQVAFYQTY